MKLWLTPYIHEVFFKTMTDWFKERNFPPVLPWMLPKTGLVVMHDEAPCAMGHLYRTDSGLAVISHLVTRPDYPGDIRNGALNLLVESLVEKAKQNKVKMVCFSTNLPKVEARFERLGFMKTDEGLNSYGRLLCHGD